MIGSDHVISSLDTHTLNEWIALIQQDSEQAKQHMIWLKARRKQQGLMADPSLDDQYRGL